MRRVLLFTCTHSNKIIRPRISRLLAPPRSRSMAIYHLSSVISHRLPLPQRPARLISRAPPDTTLCRTLLNPLPILGIRPPSLTQTPAINRHTSNHPFIHPTNPIRTVSGGTLGSMRGNNICTSSPTTYHTSLHSRGCPPSLISNSSYQILTQTSSCDPLTLPNPKLGPHRLDLNRSLLPRLPRCHISPP